MSVYVVIGYKWDCTNEHQYVAFVSTEYASSDAFAQKEVDYRGGKYGFAVFRFDGEDRDMVNYYPSIKGQDGVSFSWTKHMAELVGCEAYDCARRGETLSPDVVLRRFDTAAKADGIQSDMKEVANEQDQ